MDRLLQVHLSEKCNLKCKHCYQEGKDCKSFIDLQSFSVLLDQFKELTDYTKCDKMTMNLTGGEPLLFKNILDYIDLARAKGVGKIRLLTNGLLLTRELLQQLKDRDIGIQVSIEGTRECNDFIRGKGSFDKILKSISLAKSMDIDILVSYTLNGWNCEFVSDTIDEVYRAGAKGIWFDRVIPFNNNIPIMTEEQFIYTMQTIRDKKEQYKDSNFNVQLQRAMQFFFNDCSSCYRCSAINRAFTVLSNGDILPCRRMPISLGNFKSRTLLDIYKSNSCQKLGEAINSISDECNGCEYINYCKGGLRCLTYALHGTFNKGDVHCPILALKQLESR